MSNLLATWYYLQSWFKSTLKLKNRFWILACFGDYAQDLNPKHGVKMVLINEWKSRRM